MKNVLIGMFIMTSVSIQAADKAKLNCRAVNNNSSIQKLIIIDEVNGKTNMVVHSGNSEESISLAKIASLPNGIKYSIQSEDEGILFLSLASDISQKSVVTIISTDLSQIDSFNCQ